MPTTTPTPNPVPLTPDQARARASAAWKVTAPSGVRVTRIADPDLQSSLYQVTLDGELLGHLEHTYRDAADFAGNRANYTRAWFVLALSGRPNGSRTFPTRKAALDALLAGWSQ